MKRKNRAYKNDLIAVDNALKEFVLQDNLKITKYDILQIFHRPFSIVYKIKIQFGDGSNCIYYLKYYQREAKKNKLDVVERDFNTTQFWNERFKDHKEFNVIKPVYFSKEKFILISEESKGQNLSELINKYGQLFPARKTQEELLKMLKLVGRWLRYFQTIPIEDKYEKFTLDYFLDYLEVRLNRLVSNKKLDFDAQFKKQVITFIEEQWKKGEIDKLGYCYVHADLSLSNVLIDKDSVTVLDFNENETGLIYKDLSRLYHQLALLLNKPTFGKKLIKKLQAAFLEAYGLPDAMDKPLFKIYYLIHMLNHLNKNSRYWEHGFVENIYNRWIVRNNLKKIRKLVTEK